MVAVPIRIAMTVKATGRTFQDLEVHLWTLGEEGKVTRFRHTLDTLQLARAAGL